MFPTVNHGRKLLRGIQQNFISHIFSQFPEILENFHIYQIPFLFLSLLLVMAASSEGRSMEKRQAQSGDRFFLFGQVMSSLGESEGPHHTTTTTTTDHTTTITTIKYHLGSHLLLCWPIGRIILKMITFLFHSAAWNLSTFFSIHFRAFKMTINTLIF